MGERLCFERFELRPRERLLLHDGVPVRLGARAFDLLLALVAHRDRLVTKSELLDSAWPGLVVEEANVQVQVSALRKVLGPRAIATIPGLGYRLALDVQAEGGATRPVVTGDGRHPLPDDGDPLLGREAELQTLATLLDEHRLVTLTGPGGVGKTRLALAAARARVETAPGDIGWVDLAALDTIDGVAPAIAHAAGLALGRGEPALALRHALAARRLLLVLDNAEHLAGALAEWLAGLMEAAPGLRLLVTSQVPLHLRGEQVLALDPLELPAPGASLAAARSCAAMQLLERRARAVDRRFVVDETTLAPLVALCRRLEGLPLALEMAAARLPVLGVQGLGPLLAAPLDRLQAPLAALPARQRSLRRTLEWSHALLGEAEQRLLRRLSVFAGPVRLELVQQALADAQFDDWGVLDALAGLVDKSLVKLAALEPPRYRLLDTTRHFAAEQLAAHGETEAMQRRHGQVMAAWVESLQPRMRLEPGLTWQAAYGADYDELALAFDRAAQRGDAEVAAALLLPLRQIDQLRGLVSSSTRRLPAAVALLGRAGPRAEARLHTFIASCGWTEPPGGCRADSTRRALALWRGLDSPHDLHGALALAATQCAREGDIAAAQALLAEARALERPAWPARARLPRQVHEAWVAGLAGDAPRERALLQEALQRLLAEGEADLALALRVLLADAALAGGETEAVLALTRDALERREGAGPEHQLGPAWSLRAQALLVAGDHDAARAAALRALDRLPPDDAQRDPLLATVAVLMAAGGRPADAARLIGHLRAQPLSWPLPARVQALTEDALNGVATRLGAEQAGQLLAAGAGLPAEAASRLARSGVTE